MTQIYCFHDTVSLQYGELFTSPNDQNVIRLCENLPDNEHIYLKDTIVLCLGEFDSSNPTSPRLVPYDLPRVVWRGCAKKE